MNELLKKYQNIVIYRQALIMIVAAPIPAAMVKLQGSLLNEQTIAFIIISANVFAMTSMFLNRLSCKTLFVLGNALSFMASYGILFMYFNGFSDETIVVYFPVVQVLGLMLVGIASGKIKNNIKNKVGESFDLTKYETKKTSIASAATIIGQMLGVAFYTVSDVNPIIVLVTLETINTTVYGYAELQRWRIVKLMGVEA